MKSLFVPADCDAIRARLMALQPGNPRQWGKMNVAQMLCHCAQALETGTGDRPMKQKLIGKILAPLVRSSILGEKPFSRNAPTDPTFVVTGEREFDKERSRLNGLIDRFVQNGRANAGKQMHAFFGKLTGEQWGTLMYKHLDHHLQQFNA